MASSVEEALRSLAARLEVISANHAARFAIRRDDDWYLLKLQEELGELTQAWLKMTERGRRMSVDDKLLRQHVEDETVDVLCQLLLFARRFDIDISASIRRKWLLFDRP